jgi:hypothetical protein
MSELIKTIYALYAIPEDDYATVHAISLNQESLQEILDTKVSNKYKEMVKFEIKPIDFYLLIKFKEIIGNQNLAQLVFRPFGNEKNLSLMKQSAINLDSFKNKIFAFNKITTNDITQCLVVVAHDSDGSSDEYKEHLKYIKSQKIFENEISENPIAVNIYYDEGILNA